MKRMDSDRVLGLGKVSTEVLERSVFPFLPLVEEPGLDGGMIRARKDLAVAHSPSIGVPIEALGFFAFHYAASNVAARFALPKHLVLGIYLPLESKESELRTIAQVFGVEARRYHTTVVAGQTATYAGLEIPLLTTTCLGEPLRTPRPPKEGDSTYIMGDIGGEAIWLKQLSQGFESDAWRRFTSLPLMLQLMKVSGVVLMHDVSEGGVKKALYEFTEALNIRLDVSSDSMKFVDGVEDLMEDPLRLPTYGSMIAIVDSESRKKVEDICDELGVACFEIGTVRKGEGLYLDNELVDSLERVDLDRLYGTFEI